MSTAGQVVMITGAAGHLGRAVAAAFAADGARLILVDAQTTSLQAAFPHAAASWRLVGVDLTNQEATDRHLGDALAATGAVDVLCAIAGTFRMGEAVHDTSLRTWDTMIDVNVRSVLNAARAAVPGMMARGGGRIITIGAAAGLRGGARMGAYSAAKSAVMRLTESMAAELGASGITANCVLPSVLDTPPNRAAMPDADPALWVTPAAVAAVIRFLGSDQAAAINGALIPVSGRGA